MSGAEIHLTESQCGNLPSGTFPCIRPCGDDAAPQADHIPCGDHLPDGVGDPAVPESEALDVAFIVGEPAAFRPVGVHFPHLAAAAFTAEVGQLRAALYPGGLTLVPRRAGQLGIGAAVGVHHEKLGVALVLGHAVVAHGVGHPLGVGRGGHAPDASHGPKGFGRHAAVLDADVRTSDEVLAAVLRGFGRDAARSQCHHC